MIPLNPTFIVQASRQVLGQQLSFRSHCPLDLRDLLREDLQRLAKSGILFDIREEPRESMGRRCHIIYAHPAGADGYAFFYLYYWPGERQLALRYRQDGDEVREVALPPMQMLDLMENQASLQNIEQTQRRPWDRGSKALRMRIKSWIEAAAKQQE